MEREIVVWKIMGVLALAATLLLGGCVGFGPCTGKGNCSGVGTCEGSSECEGSGVCEGKGFCDGIGVCRGVITCEGTQTVDASGVVTCDGKGLCEGTGRCEGIGTCEGSSRCDGTGQCAGDGFCEGLGSCWPFGGKNAQTARSADDDRPLRPEVKPSVIQESGKTPDQYVRRQFKGFSVAHRGGRYWIVIEKNDYGISLVRNLGSGAKTTIIAFAKTVKAPEGAHSISKLFNEVKRLEELDKQDARYENYNYALSQVVAGQEQCIRNDFSVTDTGVPYDMGTKYRLSGFTIYCPHPNSPSELVLLGGSQRNVGGHVQPMATEEIQSFVDSLEFTSRFEN
jgi:hypothetical protein